MHFCYAAAARSPRLELERTSLRAHNHSPMAELLIYPSHSLVHRHRTEEARRGATGVCWDPKALSMNDFELRMARALLEKRVRVLSSAEEHSWLRMFVSTEPLGKDYSRMRSTPGFVPVLQKALQHCGELGLNATQLAALGADSLGLERKHLRSFAHLYGAWEAYLSQHRVRTHLLALLETIESLKKGAHGLECLKDYRQITFRQTYQLSPIQMRLLEALSSALKSRCEVLVEVPHHENPARYFRSTGRLLSQFEQTGDKLQLTVLPTALEAPSDKGLGLLESLIGARAETLVQWDRISIHQSSSKSRERLAIVEQIQTWMREGVAPECIAVAMRSMDESAQLLQLALRDGDIPVHPLPQPALTGSSLLRWFTQLLRLSFGSWQPDSLIALLSSPYAQRLVHAQPQQITHALSSILTSGDVTPAALISALEHRRDSASASCVRAIKRLETMLKPFRESQPADQFLGHVRRLIQACEFHRGAPLPHRGPAELGPLMGAGEDPIDIEVGFALGMEELGLESLERVLNQLELLARELPTPIGAETFWSILADALERQTISPPGPLNGAVSILPVRDLVGHTFEAVVIPHLVEDIFPAPSPAVALLPTLEARLLKRAPDKAHQRSTSAFEATVGIENHHDNEALLFALTVASATSRLSLSYFVQESGARLCAPSLFLEECLALARASQQNFHVHEHVETPILNPAQAFGLEQRSRAALGALCPVAPGDAAEPLAEEEVAALRDIEIPDLALTSIVRRVQIERLRLAHAFSHGISHHTAYTGRVETELWGDLPPGSKENPVSPSALETTLKCPFQDYARRVLRLNQTLPVEYDVHPREDGRFAHLCFEAVMRALIAHEMGRYRSENVQSALSIATVAIDRVFDEQWGHAQLPEGLFEHRKKILRTRLLTLIEHMYARDDGFSPRYVELSFGPDGAWPPLKFPDPASHDELWLHGRIDLVEFNGACWRAADLKRSGAAMLKKQLTPDALGHSAMQLPIYAAACAEQSPGYASDARYLALRDGEVMPTLRELFATKAWKHDPRNPDDLLQLVSADGTCTPLGEKIASLVAIMRNPEHGLRPAPGACATCDYPALCRIPSVDLSDSD